MEEGKIDVVIPTYAPDYKLFELLKKLQQQTISINRIILLHTKIEGECALHLQLQSEDIPCDYITIVSHSKEEFDHGATRHKGMCLSKGEYVLCMTQDAIPNDDQLVEKLKNALEEKEVAIAYARQIVSEKSSPIERITRDFNYPKEDSVKSIEDLERLGIKTFFCSNVCAMYRRKIYMELEGFIESAIFNEDMIYAAKVIKNKYKIAYVGSAKVLHSHSYTNYQQLQRNFDLGVSQAMNIEVFQGISSSSEGVKLVLKTRRILLEEGLRKQVLPMYVTSAYKWIGYQLGKRYHLLSPALIGKLTMNKNFWKK
ncbi:MAG: glycosyltransferase family 2 protein [Eubacteriales bacterium]